MGVIRRHWKTIAGVACGAGAGAVAAFVNPLAGIALGAACTGLLGKNATSLGQRLFEAVLGTLHPEERAKLVKRAEKERR